MIYGVYGRDGVRSLVTEGTIGVGLSLGEGEDSEDVFMVAAGGVAFPISGLHRTRMCLHRPRRRLHRSRRSHIRLTQSMGMVLTHHQKLNHMRPFLPPYGRLYHSRQPLIR